MIRYGLPAAFFAAVIVNLIGCDQAAQEDAARQRVIEEKRQLRKVEYEKDRAAVYDDVAKLLAAGKTEEAFHRGAPYRQFGDVKLEELLQEIDRQIKKNKEKEILAKVKTTKPVDHQALLIYYSELKKLNPGSTEYSNEWKKHRTALDKVQQDSMRKALAAEKARRRKEGVSIGMTKEEVLMSSWGRPEKVNSTTTARGTTEQWVYHGNYLYFSEDGRLRSIQN